MIKAAALLLIVGGSAAQTSPGSHNHAPSFFGSPEEEVRLLAVNIDNAIKLCSEQSTLAASGRKGVGKAEKGAVDSGMLRWAAEIPPQLVPILKGRAARVGQWFDPHASIWIIAYDIYPSCRVLVANSPWTATVRPALYAKIQDDAFWKLDGPESAFNGDLVRVTFSANLPSAAKIRPIISITAPTASQKAEGQLNIGVSLVEKEK